MKRILITGASGFVGSHLCEYLSDKGVEVFGTIFGRGNDISDWTKQENLFKVNLLHKDDVSRMVKKVDPNYVIHLAALSSPKISFEDGGDTTTNNIKAQLILLEALRIHATDLKKVIVVGSAEEYGRVEPDDIPVNESTPLRPTSPYAVSKIAQDYLGLQYFLTFDMPVVRLRPFNHTGDRRPPIFVLPAFARQIAMIEAGLQKPIIKVGNLEPIRDFTDVKDMVRAYYLALEKCESGEEYNIGSGQGVSIKELLDKLLLLSKVSIEVESDKKKFKPADVPILISDSKKFEGLTGWKREISLDETVKRVLNYWRQQVANNIEKDSL